MKLGPVFGRFPKSFDDDGNLGEYVVEDEEISKKIGFLPEKKKVEEFELQSVGTFKYDENLNWWEGKTKFREIR